MIRSCKRVLGIDEVRNPHSDVTHTRKLPNNPRNFLDVGGPNLVACAIPFDHHAPIFFIKK